MKKGGRWGRKKKKDYLERTSHIPYTFYVPSSLPFSSPQFTLTTGLAVRWGDFSQISDGVVWADFCSPFRTGRKSTRERALAHTFLTYNIFCNCVVPPFLPWIMPPNSSRISFCTRIYERGHIRDTAAEELRQKNCCKETATVSVRQKKNSWALGCFKRITLDKLQHLDRITLQYTAIHYD